MNTFLSTPGKWIGRGSLLIASAALIGPAAGADPTGGEVAYPPSLTAAERSTPTNYEDFREALKNGTWWLNLRWRGEVVDQDGIDKKAYASTLRTRLGYETAEYQQFSGLLEFSDVSNIAPQSNSYNSGLNGKTQYPLVADPKVTVINQVYGNYSGVWNGDLKFGRQRVNLDNQRFIGSVAYRQTEQVFDSVSYKKTDLPAEIGFFYAYVANTNNIFAVNQKSNHHFVNLSKEWENIGKLSAYGYYLDFDAQQMNNAVTFGARFAGDHAFPDWRLLYTAELAHQRDVANNPMNVDVGYIHLLAGAEVQGFTFKAGYENLGGDLETGSRSFQTPLATKFKFNGWADKFLAATPQGGLEDVYVFGGWKWQDLALAAIYHTFDRDRGSDGRYGTELDLKATYALSNGVDLGIAFADFNAKDIVNYTDTQKAWIWINYSF